MNNMKESSDIEPRVNGRLLSHVMTRESEDAARAEYRDKALGMFDTGWLSGTHLDSIIKDLENAEKKFRKEDFVTLPFEDNDLEGIQAVLSLPTVIFFGQFVWRGKDGNYRSDPRFDCEETYDETDETRLRSKFIKALGAYSRGAATWAKELGCDEAKKLLLSILSTLASSLKPDPECGIGAKQAESIVTDFIKASRLLWEEWQTVLVERGVLLSKVEESRLIEDIEKSLTRIEKIATKALKRCECYHGGVECDRKLINEALGAINDELEDGFMPAALLYSKDEEADPYDESRIGCAVLPLCERLFGKDSPHYRRCKEKVDEMGEQLTFPINRHDITIWEWVDQIDKVKKHIPQGWMDLNTAIAEALDNESEKDELKAKLDQKIALSKEEIADIIKPLVEDINKHNATRISSSRADIISLVTEISVRKNISIPAAITYLRTRTKPGDEFHDRAIEALQVAQRHIAKKRKKDASYNDENFWASIHTQAKPSNKKRAEKEKRERSAGENRAPSPISIPDKSWSGNHGGMC